MITMPKATANASSSGSGDVTDLRAFVFALFFIFGGITSLNDVIIPKLKGLFTLSYAEVMLVQSAFFAAYFIVSLPAAAILRRIGYMRTASLGLLLMTLGCLLFVPASRAGSFPLFLGALFVLAAGITTVQVVANPLISMLGAPRTAHSRLTFAQAFNSLGTTIFPYVGSILILSASRGTQDAGTLTGEALVAYRAAESAVVSRTYVGLAAALLVLSALVWWRRKRLHEQPAPEQNFLHAFDLLKQSRFGYGALSIFLYVGGEVAIGSIIVNYLMQSNVMGLEPRAAGEMVPFYWGGAMVGRFIGAWLLKIYSPGKLLASVASLVLLMLLISANTTGLVSGWTLLAIGLFNSIMFPTIFSLACEGLGQRAADGSGIICVAIVGGAIVPLITGFAADMMGLKASLLVPAFCYIGILGFGWMAREPHPALMSAAAVRQ
jgi:FHS family L-fucose permease-like MFS transporter